MIEFLVLLLCCLILHVFRENLPGHFKFKEYCPRVFHDLRKRFFLDDADYMVIIHVCITSCPPSINSYMFIDT